MDKISETTNQLERIEVTNRSNDNCPDEYVTHKSTGNHLCHGGDDRSINGGKYRNYLYGHIKQKNANSKK